MLASLASFTDSGGSFHTHGTPQSHGNASSKLSSQGQVHAKGSDPAQANVLPSEQEPLQEGTAAGQLSHAQLQHLSHKRGLGSFGSRDSERATTPSSCKSQHRQPKLSRFARQQDAYGPQMPAQIAAADVAAVNNDDGLRQRDQSAVHEPAGQLHELAAAMPQHDHIPESATSGPGDKHVGDEVADLISAPEFCNTPDHTPAFEPSHEPVGLQLSQFDHELADISHVHNEINSSPNVANTSVPASSPAHLSDTPAQDSGLQAPDIQGMSRDLLPGVEQHQSPLLYLHQENHHQRSRSIVHQPHAQWNEESAHSPKLLCDVPPNPDVRDIPAKADSQDVIFSRNRSSRASALEPVGLELPISDEIGASNIQHPVWDAALGDLSPGSMSDWTDYAPAATEDSAARFLDGSAAASMPDAVPQQAPCLHSAELHQHAVALATNVGYSEGHDLEGELVRPDRTSSQNAAYAQDSMERTGRLQLLQEAHVLLDMDEDDVSEFHVDEEPEPSASLSKEGMQADALASSPAQSQQISPSGQSQQLGAKEKRGWAALWEDSPPTSRENSSSWQRQGASGYVAGLVGTWERLITKPLSFRRRAGEIAPSWHEDERSFAANSCESEWDFTPEIGKEQWAHLERGMLCSKIKNMCHEDHFNTSQALDAAM